MIQSNRARNSIFVGRCVLNEGRPAGFSESRYEAAKLPAAGRVQLAPDDEGVVRSEDGRVEREILPHCKWLGIASKAAGVEELNLIVAVRCGDPMSLGRDGNVVDPELLGPLLQRRRWDERARRDRLRAEPSRRDSPQPHQGLGSQAAADRNDLSSIGKNLRLETTSKVNSTAT